MIQINPIFMSSITLFMKDGLQDNHWVGNSVINPVDAI